MNDTAVMEDPTLGDGEEPPDDDFELEFEEEEAKDYPWARNKSEMRRSFVLQTVFDAEMAVSVNLQQMAACDHWLVTGEILIPEEKPKKPKHLKPVTVEGC